MQTTSEPGIFGVWTTFMARDGVFSRGATDLTTPLYVCGLPCRVIYTFPGYVSAVTRVTGGG
jgi:hypothetical protein